MNYALNLINAMLEYLYYAPVLETDIWTDGRMIMTDSKEVFEKMDACFQMLRLDYTTGEIDQPGDHYYLDFEFSGGHL